MSEIMGIQGTGSVQGGWTETGQSCSRQDIPSGAAEGSIVGLRSHSGEMKKYCIVAVTGDVSVGIYVS